MLLDVDNIFSVDEVISLSEAAKVSIEEVKEEDKNDK